jgi:hypothetical protein
MVAVVLLFEYRPISSKSFNIDLAIVIHNEAQYWKDYVPVIKNTLSSILPTVFPIGQKTRVALVANRLEPPNAAVAAWHVFTGLTDNANTYKSAVNSVERIPDRKLAFKLADALNLVRTRIFTGATPQNKFRVLLILSQEPWKSEHLDQHGYDQSDAASKQLRDAGVKIFVIYERSTYEKLVAADHKKQDETYKKVLQLVGGNSEMILNMTKFDTGFNEAALRWFETALNKHLCAHKEKCFFTGHDRQRCEKGFYTPQIPMSVGMCTAVGVVPPQPSRGQCNVNECAETCDDLWSWAGATPDCKSAKCGIFNITRNGEMKWDELKFCGRNFECPCTTTSTTTTSTTTVATEVEGDTSSVLSVDSKVAQSKAMSEQAIVGIVAAIIFNGVIYCVIKNRKQKLLQGKSDKPEVEKYIRQKYGSIPFGSIRAKGNASVIN